MPARLNTLLLAIVMLSGVEAVAAQDGKAYITRERPAGLTLAANLSLKDRRENFDALWSVIDAQYAHFALKSIDWDAIGRRYRARLDAVTGDDDYYRLLFQLVNELKDTHSWVDNYNPPRPADVPDLSTDLFQDKVFVVAGPRAGWEVVSVDGMTPAQKMESLKPSLRATSSERAFRREASRLLLTGNSKDAAIVMLRSPDGQVETLSLRRGGRKPRPPVRAPAIELSRQQFVQYGRLASGLAYIQIESFDGRQEIAREFDRALDALRDAPGLLLDIRGNPGGFGQPAIVGRFVTKRTLAGFSYIKSGPRHGELRRSDMYISPSGEWQYTRPVALLINDTTASAADLFALQLRSAANVVTVGTTTHGNLSGVAVYAVLPCNLVVRISNGYISDTKNRPVEVNGNIPDVIVDPDVRDYLSGRDPVLERASEIVVERLRTVEKH
jgi:carboxyl-terminal processing protease